MMADDAKIPDQTINPTGAPANELGQTYTSSPDTPLAGHDAATPRWPGGAIFFTVPKLATLARSAVERTQSEETRGELLPEQHDAIVAVIMSAATLEAFINQYGSFAEYWHLKMNPAQKAAMTTHVSQLLDRTNASAQERELALAIHDSMLPFIEVPPSVASCSAMLVQLEKSRVDTETKFVWASICLKNVPYDKGSKPFQDFSVLVRLRNQLIHPNIEGWLGYLDSEMEPLLDHKRLHRELSSRKLILPSVVPEHMSLVDLISTRSTARWAYNTAVAMIQSVLEMTPAGSFRDSLERMLDAVLKPI